MSRNRGCAGTVLATQKRQNQLTSAYLEGYGFKDMMLAPRKVVTFKCSGKLRKRVNE